MLRNRKAAALTQIFWQKIAGNNGSLNDFWHSGDSKTPEINYYPAYNCSCHYIEIATHCLVSPPPLPFLRSLSVLLPICHVVHQSTERTGEEAVVKVREWEIQLGGKRM